MFSELIEYLKQNSDVRKALVELKGELRIHGGEAFKASKGYTPTLLKDLLKNEDPKSRKLTAVIMGVVIEDDYLETLYEAYCAETVWFVKSAYLKGILSYNYDCYRANFCARIEELESRDVAEDELKHIAEELKALRKLVPESITTKGHFFRNPLTPVNVVFTAKKEVRDVLQKKMLAFVDEENTKQIFCGVMTTTSKISMLSKIRIYKDILFPINKLKPIEKSDLHLAIACGDLLDLIELMHDDGRSAFRFRITGNNVDLSMLSAKVEALGKSRLVNSPSNYEIEILLIEGKDEKYLTFLKLHTINTDRFAYRKGHVAASIHPVNAATVAELTKEYMQKDAQILDPCCGVGTMLIERNMLVPAKHIYGIDIFGEAVNAGRENAKAAGVDINFINKDYFDFTHEYLFDEIITNLPDFRTREETDEFYEKFFAKSYDILKANGIMIITCCEKNLVKKHLRLSSGYKLLREFTISEKEGREIFVIKKLDN